MARSGTLTFKRALILAAMAHVFILVVLLVRVSFASPDKKSLVINPQTSPIEAVAITEKEYQQEITRLNQIEQKKREAKLAEERKIRQAQEKARKEKEAEQQRIAEAKKQKLLEQQRLEAQRKQAEAAEKQKKLAQAKAEQQKMADAAKAKADAQRAREAKAAAEKLAAQTAAINAAKQAEALAEIERYSALVRQQIMRYWTVQGGLAQQDATKLFVRVASSGTVLDVKVLASSGNDARDRSAVAAVYKASPLPVPQDPELFRSFRELRLILRPDSILSEG